MDKKITMDDLFNNIEEYSEEFDLYLPSNQIWNQETLCKLLSNEDEINENISITELNYQYILGLYNVKDVLDNIKMQNKNATIEDFIIALKFYFNNDAFIRIGHKE